MNQLRMDALRKRSDEMATGLTQLVRLSRDDKRLESLLLTAREALDLARERAAENLKKREIADA